MYIRFNKIDRFIKIHNKIRYIALFDEWCDKICDRIKHLTSGKSDTIDSTDHNIGRNRIDSYNYLPAEKILTFHNAVLLIKSAFNSNKNQYYYNIFLEKGSHKN